MDSGGYYLLKEDGTIERETDLIKWARQFEYHTRIVKQERTWLGYWVSTVFLGIDHNWNDHGDPVLFETMTFAIRPWMTGHARKGEVTQRRCCTLKEAHAMHRKEVALASIPFYWPINLMLIILGWQVVGLKLKSKRLAIASLNHFKKFLRR